MQERMCLSGQHEFLRKYYCNAGRMKNIPEEDSNNCIFEKCAQQFKKIFKYQFPFLFVVKAIFFLYDEKHWERGFIYLTSKHFSFKLFFENLKILSQNYNPHCSYIFLDI